MIEEAMQYFADQVNSEQWRELDGDLTPTARAIINTHTGEHKLVVRPQQPRRTEVATIESFTALVDRFGEDSSVYLQHESATGVLTDNNARHDTIVLKWSESPLFGAVRSLSGKSPKDMLDILRFDMFAAEKSPADLITRLSKLKFEESSSTETDHGHADDGVSRRIKSSVTGEGDIPLECTFSFAPFPSLQPEMPEFTVSICCAVKCNASRGQVSILPYPAEVAAARQSALHNIRSVIQGISPELPVYIGGTRK